VRGTLEVARPRPCLEAAWGESLARFVRLILTKLLLGACMFRLPGLNEAAMLIIQGLQSLTLPTLLDRISITF